MPADLAGAVHRPPQQSPVARSFQLRAPQSAHIDLLGRLASVA